MRASVPLLVASAIAFGGLDGALAEGLRHRLVKSLQATSNNPEAGGSTPRLAARTKKQQNLGNGMSFQGGPIMLGTKRVYYIWYGDWAGSTAPAILVDLAKHIGGSSWFNINTVYFNAAGKFMRNEVAYGGSAADNYSEGTAFDVYAVERIVDRAISSGQLPADDDGVYFVLTSADVYETDGFCDSFCGYHVHSDIQGKNLKWAFVGNADRCPSSCAAQTTSPNGNAGADAMASAIAHELAESATDPDLNAWRDAWGRENADKCAWKFGQTQTAANGSLYNITLGNRQYLIQQNWVPKDGGYCAMQ